MVPPMEGAVRRGIPWSGPTPGAEYFEWHHPIGAGMLLLWPAMVIVAVLLVGCFGDGDGPPLEADSGLDQWDPEVGCWACVYYADEGYCYTDGCHQADPTDPVCVWTNPYDQTERDIACMEAIDCNAATPPDGLVDLAPCIAPDWDAWWEEHGGRP